MAETGFDRFTGTLDPRAQEFRPRYPTNLNSPGTALFVTQPHQVYYSFSSPYPPISEVPVLPFCDGGVAYPHFPAPPPPYVSNLGRPTRSPAQPLSSVATRSLLLSSVPCDVSETVVRRELEAFGDVRGVQMEKVSDGIVIVHFYDIRHSERALREIRDQHMQQQCRLRDYYNRFLLPNSTAPWSDFPIPRPSPAPGLISGHAVWAQFIIPASNAVPAGQNQGTVVIFNLDSAVSTSCLREIFETFGSVKELRETPMKKHQRFVEFFDIRDAGKALKEMNGKEINGKPIVIEFSRPGGHGNKLFNPNLTGSLCPPLSRPPPPPRKFSGGAAASNVPPRSWCYPKAHSFSRKLSSHKGSQNPNNLKSSDSGDVNGKMASLDLDDRELCGALRRNSKKTHNGSAFTADQQQLQPCRSTKPRKCRQSRKFDSRFLINNGTTEDSDCRDLRTTVMIKNIPNKYSQKLLLNMLDNHCIHCNEQMGGGSDGDGEGDDRNQPLSSYDFVYLPIDFNNKCNVGYGFVNMTSPEATWRLYKAFHLQPWEVFNSRKICEVTYARVQGLEALKEHFKNSKFPCEMDHYLPVVFSPPRDGRELTEPLPIGGQKQPISIPLPTETPSSSSPQSPSSANDEIEMIDSDDCETVDQEEMVIGINGIGSSRCSSSQNGGGVDDDYSNYEDM